MTTPNLFQTMTDDQIALWHQQDAQIQKLKQQLLEKGAEFLAAVGNTVELQGQYAAERRRLGDEVLALTQQLADQKNANRRLCAEQVQLLRTLRELLESLRGFAIGFPSEEQADRHCRAWREAEEVLKLCEVPFG